MTPRSLFIVILRVIGILFLKELLTAIPQFISAVLSFSMRYSISEGMLTLLISLLTVLLYLWISFKLIFKADNLVTMFALDKGFAEEKFELSISVRAILHIAIVVTGGIILLTSIPDFCSLVYGTITEQSISFLSTGKPDWTPAVFAGVKIILGLLIIGERKRILDLLQKSPDREQTR